MGTVQARITNEAEACAKKYGSSVSKGILEMHRRLEIIESRIVAPPVGEMTISEKDVRRIANAVYDKLENLIGTGS
jgi:hypothetical protein